MKQKNNTFRHCLTAIVSLCTMSGFAQTEITDTLGEVTVVETRHQQALRSTAPMHLLGQDDMSRRGVTDVADALHRLPGITLRDYGGAGGMKTVCVRGFGAKHTGVSYDGVMLSECQSGEIDLSRYGVENIDYLQLTIGDNDNIFVPARQAASPAVLSIKTLTPVAGQRQSLMTQLKAGSFGYVSPFLHYAAQLSPALTLDATADYTYADNNYPYEKKNVTITMHDRRTNSRMSAGHGELGLLYTPAAGCRLSGKVYYYDNDRQLPGPTRYYTNLSGETLHDRNFFVQLQGQQRLAEQWSVKGGMKFNWSESVYRDGLYASGISDASYWQREAYATVALLYTPEYHWAFDYSADYSWNNLNGSSWRTVVGRPFRNTILQSATAKYSSPRLTATARLLHSLYLNDAAAPATSSEASTPTARNMRRLSPSLSLSWRLYPSRELFLRASYKNIFRSPTFNESYYYHYGSTDLLPEVTDQLNLGITCATASVNPVAVRVTVDGYYNKVRDMIVSVPYNMFVWTCINVGKVRIIGLDVTTDLSWQPTAGHRISLAANYSYQQAENRSNPESPYYSNQIAYIPLHTVDGSVNYENPWLNVTFHGHGLGDRWANNEHYDESKVRGYADFGLTLYRSIRWGKHCIEGRFDLKNLFNAHYEIVAAYPMPGRSYTVAVKWII